MALCGLHPRVATVVTTSGTTRMREFKGVITVDRLGLALTKMTAASVVLSGGGT